MATDSLPPDILRDETYDAEHKLAVDVYLPVDANGAAVIDLHGGGWFRGDKAKDADWATALAEAGYVVFVPNYRLAPNFHYPAPNDDLDTLLEWIRHSEFLFDRTRIGVVGSSAGGNLAIEMALRHGIPAVSWSGIIEIDDWLSAHESVVPAMDTKQNFNAASATIDQTGGDDTFYKWFVLNYTGDDAATIRDASLLHRVSASSGPMLLVNSMHELVPATGIGLLQKALYDVDVPSMTKLVTGTQHAKGYLAEAMPYTLDFLAQYLAAPKAS